MNIVIILLLAYLLGSIPSALWIGKIFYKTDIRKHGSGNLGATNTFRTLGVKAGLIVSILDILKGTAATLLPLIPFFSVTDIHPLILGVVAVVGHMYPIFANFKGGKAVATSGGVLLAYHWPIFILMLVSFFIVLKLSKMVSFTSMVLGIIGLVYTTLYNVFYKIDIPLLVVIILLTSFVLYRHRANIVRIKAGTEPKVKWL
ncbi:glycerol-3-phosphate 1-O-acyltransferase PlsY [Paenisporosarcina antarctica]|uniref:Glycerol-3-phosphate acyltransferase n=1 Tax=Paenisporosarcina antarctica TaxID=417367 RepID=A0A4P6ZY12_9BACL|nr:glycerol-3-phosphate 1-O-acyltransferase PlsY [Paenisporosarcina antarctica]QBP41058.1 glycerol-3-phosphate 1-O-acyltransferase PlsY [Paenisporosarcina antarctica]